MYRSGNFFYNRKIITSQKMARAKAKKAKGEKARVVLDRVCSDVAHTINSFI